MNKKINPAFIGAFVLIAAIITVLVVLYFGARKYTGEQVSNVAFFRSQTHGLEVGAPVVLKGVKIGNVTRINVGYEAQAESFYVRVEFVTDRTAVLWPQSRVEMNSVDPEELRHKLIEQGFRARLATQSLVTGKLMVELGFFPNTKVNLQGDIENEIPTIPTPIEEMWEDLGQIDIAGIAQGIETIINGLDDLVNNNNLKEIEQETLNALKSLNRVTVELQQLTAKLNGRIDGLADSFESASNEVGRLALNINEQVTPLSGDLRNTLKSLDQSLVSARETLELANQSLAKDSPLQLEAVKALRSISDAARSFRGFTEYLERHPEALLSGKR